MRRSEAGGPETEADEFQPCSMGCTQDDAQIRSWYQDS